MSLHRVKTTGDRHTGGTYGRRAGRRRYAGHTAQFRTVGQSPASLLPPAWTRQPAQFHPALAQACRQAGRRHPGTRLVHGTGATDAAELPTGIQARTSGHGVLAFGSIATNRIPRHAATNRAEYPHERPSRGTGGRLRRHDGRGRAASTPPQAYRTHHRQHPACSHTGYGARPVRRVELGRRQTHQNPLADGPAPIRPPPRGWCSVPTSVKAATAISSGSAPIRFWC